MLSTPSNTAKKPHRGALENPTGRFEALEATYDPNPDWAAEPGEEVFEETLKTRFYKDASRNVLTHNNSPDIGFDFSINPYRGCEHGCIYCYARPTHEYLGMSAGLDFESKILVKTDAPALLRKALLAKKWKPQVIVMSGVTDCYQPAERHFKITRQCLEVLAEFRNPVGIITKNHLVTRDVDVLSELAQYNAIRVMVSITTLDDSLVSKMEPRTSRPIMRLKAIEALSNAGVSTGVMMGPIIPGLTDHEVDSVLRHAADAGAQTASHTLVRLPYGVKDLFSQWLETHFPDRKNRVLNRLRDMHNGELNDNRFGKRMSGEGHYADYINAMFDMAKKRYGLKGRSKPLSSEHFRTNGSQQLSLF